MSYLGPGFDISMLKIDVSVLSSKVSTLTKKIDLLAKSMGYRFKIETAEKVFIKKTRRNK